MSNYAINYDFSSVFSDSLKIDRHPDGFLRIQGTIVKVGWLRYVNQDGDEHWELATPEALFDPSHLNSLGMAPLTLDHPSEMVTPSNWKKYAIGNAGNKIIANKKEGLIEVTYVIGDEEAIAAVESRDKIELSPGYKVWKEKRSDGKYNQIKRICNHHALCKEARGGHDIRLHLDSREKTDESTYFLAGYDSINTNVLIELKSDKSMEEKESNGLTIKGKHYSQEDVERIIEELEDMKKKYHANNDSLIEASSQLKVAKTKIDELERQVNDDSRIRDRITLQKRATPLLERVNEDFTEDSFQGMSDVQIKESVIVASDILKGMSPEDAMKMLESKRDLYEKESDYSIFLDTRFDTEISTPPPPKKRTNKLNALLGTIKTDKKNEPPHTFNQVKQIENNFLTVLGGK